MKLICGPMATISHPAFRILIEKFGGCDEYYTEMINAGTLLTGGPFEKYYINPAPQPQKVVWQLTGHDTKNMVQAAQVLVKLPGIGLDINMGCSAPDIYRFGAGIGWMLKPIEETREMVEEVSKIILNHNRESGENKRFSVKLRLGNDNFTDQGFYDFCDMLIENKVQLLTLHPRTKKEKLIRPARYFYCQELSKRYKEQGISVYLNGNVKDKASYDYALQTCPDVDGVMISRAAVKQPWIFAQLKGMELSEINMKDLAF
ncbi:MAG: tRNA-dihydrouridine synthase family protein, partial [Treponema sp.]|nr:tRNA-dihydrouridine synthase family protein [Treponema sp.]